MDVIEMVKKDMTVDVKMRKRSRVVLSFDKKLEIIKRLKKGESAADLSREYGVARQTVSDMRRNATKIETYANKLESIDGCGKIRKTMKSANDTQLDSAIYQWFIQQRMLGISVTGPMIMEQALIMNAKLNGSESFKASSGWLHNFQSRHGIRQLSIEGEKLGLDTMTVIDYARNLFSQFKDAGLSGDQIYNGHLTFLNWKALPKKSTSLTDNENPLIADMREEMLTSLICYNSNGSHKLPVVITGKVRNPFELNDFDISSSSVNYYNQSCAWMTKDIFRHWFYNEFLPRIQNHLVSKMLPANAVLLIHNDPFHAHKDCLWSDDGLVKCIFLPANVSALIQPLDKGITRHFKHGYRKAILNTLSQDFEMDRNEFQNNFNISGAMLKITEVWKDLPELLLIKSWNMACPVFDDPKIHTSFEENNKSCNEDNIIEKEIFEICKSITGLENISESEVRDWLEMEHSGLGCPILTDDEIIESVACNNDEELHGDKLSVKDEPISDNEPIASPEIISHYEAEVMLTKCFVWLSEQSEADPNDLMVLARIRDLAARKNSSF